MGKKIAILRVVRAALLSGLIPLAACAQQRTHHSYSHAPRPAFATWEFGAATERNIATLLDDPLDLDLARRETPRDSQRRNEILSAYRSGGTTGAGMGTSFTAPRIGGQQ